MFEFFAYTFGYVLNFIYNIINNYGFAIILFTIFVKLLLLPISIKQQRTMKKSAKIQEQVKALQFKYKNDPQKMNQEMMSLYKAEKMSPFSGCLSAIVQIILLLSVFYLVRSPLTFMKQVPKETIDTYIQQMKEEGKIQNSAYPEIDIIREKGPENEQVRINMEFLGLDLSQVPNQNMQDFRVYIIPVLYIISSVISMRITTAMQKQQNKKKKEEVIDITENKDGEEIKEIKEENNDADVAMQTSKTMSWLIPIMSISIAFIAPLGLALYWLVNNVLMIVERLLLNKFLKEEE
ncbi:MAG: YidC/Oxa1 family membrane protein insertase [Clostridia bacterium]|nr:YidC/Oxa1 family membrane protein insertase [Clostridia bacterium]